MNIIERINTNYIFIAIGTLYLLEVFTQTISGYGIDFWITYAVVLKCLGAIMVIVGALMIEGIGKKKSFWYFSVPMWGVGWGLVAVFISIMMTMKVR